MSRNWNLRDLVPAELGALLRWLEAPERAAHTTPQSFSLALALMARTGIEATDTVPGRTAEEWQKARRSLEEELRSGGRWANLDPSTRTRILGQAVNVSCNELSSPGVKDGVTLAAEWLYELEASSQFGKLLPTYLAIAAIWATERGAPELGRDRREYQRVIEKVRWLNLDWTPNIRRFWPAFEPQNPRHAGLLRGIDENLAARFGEFIQHHSDCRFGGRLSEIETLAAWQHESSPPPVLVYAPIGGGKSGFLTQLALRLAGKNENVAFLPTSITFDTAHAEIALSALDQRLAFLLSLHATRGGTKTLAQLQLRVESSLQKPRQRKLFLIVDGLDEALNLNAQGLFAAARRGGVHLVASVRGDPTHSAHWSEVFGLSSDTRVVELPPLSQTDVARVLAQVPAGKTANPAVFFELTSGDPLLLRLYVDELADKGAPFLDSLPARAPGLASFIQSWREEAGRTLSEEIEVVSALLHVLAFAREPLPAEDMRAVLGKALARRVRPLELDAAIHHARRFVVGDGEQRGFALGHRALAEHLALELDGSERREHEASYVKVGLESARAVSNRALPPDQARRYFVRYLHRHLRGARSPVSDWSALADRSWAACWENTFGATDGFLRDLARARGKARASNRANLRAGAPIEHAGLEIECSLIEAEVRESSRHIRPDTLAQLVRLGLWTKERALGFAHTIPVGFRRVSALLALAKQSEDGDWREDLLDEAVRDALALPPEVLEQELVAEGSIESAFQFAFAIPPLIPYVANKDQLLGRLAVICDALGSPDLAVDVALGIQDSLQFGLTLEKLSPDTIQSRLAVLLARSEAGTHRDECVVAIVQKLEAIDPKAAMDCWIGSGRNPEYWSPVLPAPILPEAPSGASTEALHEMSFDALLEMFAYRRELPVLEVLLESIRAQGTPVARARQVLKLVPLLHRTDLHLPLDLFEEAKDTYLADTQDRRVERAMTVTIMAACAPPGTALSAIDWAVDLVDSYFNGLPRVRALQSIAYLAPDESAKQILKKLFEQRTDCGDARWQAQLLAELAPHCSAPVQQAALAHAVALTPHVENGERRVGIFLAAAECDPAYLTRALSEPDSKKAHSLERASRHMSPEQAESALGAARELGVATELAIGRRIAPDRRAELVQELIARARAEGVDRVLDLASSPHISPGTKDELLQWARSRVGAAPGGEATGQLVRIAKLLNPTERRPVVDEALESAQQIEPLYRRLSSQLDLAELMQHEPEPCQRILARSLAALPELEEFDRRSVLLRAIDLLESEALEKALLWFGEEGLRQLSGAKAAGETEPDTNLAVSLAKMVVVWLVLAPPTTRWDLFARVACRAPAGVGMTCWNVATQSARDAKKPERLAYHIPPWAPPSLLREVVREVIRVDDPTQRASLLGACRPALERLPATSRHALLGMVLRSAATRGRRHVLNDLLALGPLTYLDEAATDQIARVVMQLSPSPKLPER